MEKHRLELDCLRPIPKCVCEVTCSCTLIPTIISHKESGYVIMFQRVLNDSFANNTSQIMMMTPLTNVEKDFNLLTQQERKMSQDLDESKIFVNNSVSDKKKFKNNFKGQSSGSSKSQKSRGQSNKVHNHCHCSGHTVDTCFKIHDFSAQFKKVNATNNCVADEEQSLNSDDDSDSQESGQGTNVEEANFDFTPEQKRALLAILQQNGSSNSHHINHVKTKVNHNKHATSKCDKPNKEDQGTCGTLSSIYNK
jgi:hypothetical protein